MDARMSDYQNEARIKTFELDRLQVGSHCFAPCFSISRCLLCVDEDVYICFSPPVMTTCVLTRFDVASAAGMFHFYHKRCIQA